MRWAAIAVLLLVAVVIIKGRSAAAPEGAPVDGGSVVADLTAGLATVADVASASGAYVFGVGPVVQLRLADPGPADLHVWLAEGLTGFAAQLVALPATDELVVIIDLPDGHVQVIAVPVGTATDTGTWVDRAAVAPAPPTTSASSAGTATASAGSAVADPAGGVGATPMEAPTTTSAASVTSAATSAADGDTFDGALSDRWSSLTGTWATSTGVLRQSDASGYDYITQFAAAAGPGDVVTVRMRPVDAGELASGIILGQPTTGTRNGASMIDITAGATFVRWGGYDAANGVYTYSGGAALPQPADPATWHTLQITMTATETVVVWDEAEVGRFGATSKGGVGLVTSMAAVDFDDFAVKSS